MVLGPIRVRTPNSISIGSAIFAQLTAEGPYTLQWTAPSPSTLSMGGSGPHLIAGSFGPPESTCQMASGSVQPFWLTIVTARQTDHANPSVTVGCIYVLSSVIRPNNNGVA